MCSYSILVEPLGDIEFKNTETFEEGPVSCDPEVRVFPLSHSDPQFLILTSDGIWYGWKSSSSKLVSQCLMDDLREVYDSEGIIEEIKGTLSSVQDRLKDNVDPTQELYT